MSLTKGSVVLITIGSTTIVGQVGGSMNIAADVMEVTRHNGTARVKDFLPTSSSWGLSVEGLYDPDAAEGADDSITYLKAGTLVTVTFGETPPGSDYFTGSGYISSVDINGPKNDIANYSINIVGTGVLTEYVVGAEYDYYMSSSAGSDAYDGDSESEAWETLSKLNTEIIAGTLDGKTVAFKKGDSWTGTIDTYGRGNIDFVTFGTSSDEPEITGKKTLGDSWVHEGSNIWYYLDAALEGNVRYLYSNSVKMPIAKLDVELAESGSTTTVIDTASGLSASDDYYNGAEIYVRPKAWRWDGGFKVTDYTGATNEITFSQPASYAMTAGKGYFMQNCYNILVDNATQGEWIHDKDGDYGTADRIYMYSTTDPYDLTGDIEVSSLNTVVKIDNSDSISFTGFDFTYANQNAITNNQNNSESLSFADCNFSDVVCPIWLDYADDLQIVRCTITNAGAQGFYIEHADRVDVWYNSINNVGLVKSEGYYNASSIIDYDTKHLGMLMRSCESGTVQFNTFSGIGSNCISVIYSENYISVHHNYFTNYCLTADDCGAIYVWGSTGAAGNKLIYNNICEQDWTGSLAYEGYPEDVTHGYEQGWNVSGIYIDGVNTDGYYVYDNVCLNNYNNIKFRSDNHYVYDNICAMAVVPTGYDDRWWPAEIFREVTTTEGRTSTFTGNTFIGKYDSARGLISPNATLWTNSYMITEASDTLDYNEHHMPFLNDSSYLNDTIQVYAPYTITTTAVGTDDFSVGDEIEGGTSGATGTITAITGSSPTYTFEYYRLTGTNFQTAAETITNNTATGSATKDGNAPSSSTTSRFLTLDEWKANSIVGTHTTGTVMLYSITGLSDIDDYLWYATNATTSTVLVNFPSGYYYYTTAGDRIAYDALTSFQAKVYFRTIEEGMPQIDTPTFTGTVEVGETVTSVDPSTIYSHAEGNSEDSSTYQWYVSADNTKTGRVAIAGETSSTYVIGSYAGSYLILGIVPKAAAAPPGTGTLLTGVERFSAPVLIGA